MFNDVGNHSNEIKNSQIQDEVHHHGNGAAKSESGIIPENNSLKLKEEIHCNTEADIEVKTYRTRIWILAIFTFFAFFQTVIWGTFGPITTSAKYAFGWDDNIIAISQSSGIIAIFIFIVPMTWFTQTYGLRTGMLSASIFVAVGTGIRCISSSNDVFTVLAILGGAISLIGGCITLGIPPMISAIWFPPQERTTATAIGALGAQLGGAGMYLSPLIVRSPAEDWSNSSSNKNGVYVSENDVKNDIMRLMYIEFGIAVVLLLCIVFYFPNRPPNPPSDSSKIERVKYFSSIKILFRNTKYLIVMITYTFSYGVPAVWFAVMNFSLQCIGIDQNQVMWIGIAACIVGSISALTVAWITDIIYGYMKITIISLLLLSSAFFLWYVLLVGEVITPSLVQVYIAIVGGFAAEFATVPLLIELGVELAYPCSETVVGASFTTGFSFVSGIFLLLFIIPTKCYYWAGYVLIACTSISTIPLYFVKEIHKRSTIDGK